MYSLGILIIVKVIIPNPNFPVMATPRGEAKLFEHFQHLKNHTVAVVPNTTDVQVRIGLNFWFFFLFMHHCPSLLIFLLGGINIRTTT